MNSTVISPKSFYAPVCKTEQETVFEHYLEYLYERNGGWNRSENTFPARETWTEELQRSEVYARRQVHQKEFDEHYVKFQANKTCSIEMITALAFAKINAGEAYGVRVIRPQQIPSQFIESDHYNHIMNMLFDEELIHTKLLVGATKHFGLQVDRPFEPTLPLRLLIRLLAHSPRSIYHPLLLASEVAGIYLFNFALQRVRILFKDQGELRDCLEARLVDVMIDELGHITFNRWWVGRFGLTVGKTLAPLVAESMPQLSPELTLFGYDQTAMQQAHSFDYPDLPEEVRRRGFFL